MPNRLINESSPYLLQHADNPVDWFPWGEEALQKAEAEDKPIFLSIGYSACHWCHVMAHESFEDERVAAILNEHFVSIKVDREERPELDRIYMAAVQTMTGSGGWPLSVFLTPAGHPFYGGTYLPPVSRHGMPSFSDVLLAVIQIWRDKRQEVLTSGRQFIEAIDQQLSIIKGGDPQACRPDTLTTAFQNLRQRFDRAHGGWGAAPKFPQPMALEFLLRYHHTTGDSEALSMVTQTLEAMARGGMYDQLGGGFHRYSVDDHWLVPHFEKMLYDNAQLARVYLHAWQVTDNPLFLAIAEEVLNYVLREMTSPEGGFYSTQDADSEGEEGKFFLWAAEEIRALLGAQADPFLDAYGVTDQGNFEGKNILSLVEETGRRDELADVLQQLFTARKRRVPPGRDDKILVSWNGLMLATFAEAARVLGRDDYRQAAEGNAAFLLGALGRPDGRLWHTWTGRKAKVNGFLEDYSHLIEGLLELYQATFDPRWYLAAVELAQAMVAHFRAPEFGFYDTSDDHEELILRPREWQDGALPSGNSMAALILLRLAGLALMPDYSDLARRTLSGMQLLMAQYPLGFSQWLVALDYALAQSREIAIVGEPDAADTAALLKVASSGYRPHQVVAMGAVRPELPAVPLLGERLMVDGKATAYVCVDYTCQVPVTDPEALQALLEGLERP